jgi:hemerythrin-like metal-binding protein
MQRQCEIVLGFDPMDDIHADFEQYLAQALDCADHELLPQLEALAAHLRSHFAAEDGWMRESGFPPAQCHIDEHAAVLRSADEALQLVAQGRLPVGRAFVRELASWFPAHADHLDSALAAWMSKRRFGGKPVVLRRSAAVRG